MSALSHILADFEGMPDSTLVQLIEYEGDMAVAENDDFNPGEDAERAATLGQLRRSITNREQWARDLLAESMEFFGSPEVAADIRGGQLNTWCARMAHRAVSRALTEQVPA